MSACGYCRCGVYELILHAIYAYARNFGIEFNVSYFIMLIILNYSFVMWKMYCCTEVEWQTVHGRFAAINSFLISCRCRYAFEGPAPAAHLGDGCSDLVLIRSCSRLDYTRHLIRCTDKTADQVSLAVIS